RAANHIRGDAEINVDARREHDRLESHRQRLTAKTGPSGMRMTPKTGNPSRCVFEWVLNVDLKLPISDRVLSVLISGKLKQSVASLHVRLAGHCEPMPQLLKDHVEYFDNGNVSCEDDLEILLQESTKDILPAEKSPWRVLIVPIRTNGKTALIIQISHALTDGHGLLRGMLEKIIDQDVPPDRLGENALTKNYSWWRKLLAANSIFSHVELKGRLWNSPIDQLRDETPQETPGTFGQGGNIDFFGHTSDLRRSLRSKPLNLKEVIWQWDNTRPHRSAAVNDFMTQRDITTLFQRRYNPDIRLCDRFLFPW
ncbi:unnamed protein product, partial [Darwinula stevensoni]